MSLRLPLLIASVFCCAACASTTVPNEKAESSSASIRAAEEVGATHNPAAALHLQLAKEQFEYAQHLPSSDDKDRMERLLARAQADAELALALSRTDADKSEAQAAVDKLSKFNASATR